MTDVVVLLTGGWGSDGWGETAFGQDTVPELAPALTADTGTVVANGDATASLAGVTGTGAVGTVDATGISVIDLEGVSTTAETSGLRFDVLVSFAGWGRGGWGEGAWSSNVTVPSAEGATNSVGVVTNVDVFASGLQGAAAVGSVNVVPGTGTTVVLDGLVGSTAVGETSIVGNSTTSVTGLSATTSVGGVTQRTSQVIPVVAPDAAVATVNPVAEVTGDANVFVTGLRASAEVNRVLVWGREIPDPGTVWTEIAA